MPTANPTSIRLAILGQSPCERCWARCCKQNGHEYAVLLEGDEPRRFAPWAQSVPIRTTGGIVRELILPYRDGRCIFLDTEDRCTIYDSRPVNCRRFECIPGFRRDGDHSEFLKRNGDVLRMLEEL